MFLCRFSPLFSYVAVLQDPCDHVYNRKGYIALCVAENKLVLDLVSERFSQSATTAFADINVYCYDSFVGMPILRKAVAYFLARRFLYSDIEVNITPEQALEVVQPKCIGIAAGAAAILSHLFFILGEQGEACLIPAPYYAAFENDMKVVAGIEPVAILQADPVAGPTEEELNKAFHEAQKVSTIFAHSKHLYALIELPSAVQNVSRGDTGRSLLSSQIPITPWVLYTNLRCFFELLIGQETRKCTPS